MGKIMNKRFRNNRFQILESKDVLSVLNATAGNSISSVLSKLQSSEAEERECACIIVTHICTKPEILQECLSKGIVKILGPLLHDSSVFVKLAAVGALRNLTVEGGVEVCEKFVTDDVMTPLLVLCSQVPNHLADDTSEGELFTNAFQLLSNLCESSETVRKISVSQNSPKNVVQYMKTDCFGHHFPLAIGRFLYTISEDNTTMLMDDQELELLVASLNDAVIQSSAKDTKQLLLKAYQTGILYHLSSQKSQSLLTCLPNIISFISTVLSTDHISLLHTACEELKLEMMNDSKDDGGDDGFNSDAAAACINIDMAEDEEPCEVPTKDKRCKKTSPGESPKAVEMAQCLFLAEQVALEILTNLCCSDVEEEEYEVEDENDSEGSLTDDIVESMQVCNVEDPIEKSLRMLTKQHRITDKIYDRLSNAVPPEIITVLHQTEEGNTLADMYHNMSVSSLLCINNMGTLEGMADENEWKKFSVLLCQRLNSELFSNATLLEPWTSALRSIIDRLSIETVSDLLVDINIDNFVSCLNLAKDENVQINLVRIIGRLGCAVAKHPAVHSTSLKSMAELLQQVFITPNVSLRLAAEALDITFDVFAEDGVINDILVQSNLLSTLNQIDSILRKRFRDERKQYSEHVPLISTSMTNLRRFIKYKTKMIR